MAKITLKLLDTKRIIPIGIDGFEINVENKNGGMVIAGENNVSEIELIFSKEFIDKYNSGDIKTDDMIYILAVNSNNEHIYVRNNPIFDWFIEFDGGDIEPDGTYILNFPITSELAISGYTKFYISWKSWDHDSYTYNWERFDLKIWSTDPNYVANSSLVYVPFDWRNTIGDINTILDNINGEVV